MKLKITLIITADSRASQLFWTDPDEIKMMLADCGAPADSVEIEEVPDEVLHSSDESRSG